MSSAPRNYYDSYSDQISHAFEQLQKEVENDKTLIEQQKATIERMRYSIAEKKALDTKYKELADSERRVRQYNESLKQELYAEKRKSSRASMNVGSLEDKIAELNAKLKRDREETEKRFASQQQIEREDLKRKFDAEVEAYKAQYDRDNNNNNNNRYTYEVLINNDNDDAKRVKDLEAEVKALKAKNATYEKAIKEMGTSGMSQLSTVKGMLRDMMANGKHDKTMIDRMRSVDAVRQNEIATLKRDYEAKVSRLEKQKKYQMDLNQKLKKKLLATQYTFGGHEMIRRATLLQSTAIKRQIYRKNFAVFKRTMVQALSYMDKKIEEEDDESTKLLDQSAQSQSDCIYKNAKEIVKTTANCPDCSRPFEDIASLKKHMTLFHMKQYSDSFDGPIVVERSPTKRKRTANHDMIVDVE